MPFDAITSLLSEDEQMIQTLRDRRERAAVLWLEVPPEKFSLNMWRCGSAACALGWLAVRKHDGWGWNRPFEIPRSPGSRGDPRDIWLDTARYFGTTIGEAVALFSSNADTYSLYRTLPSMVTAAQVADKLLAMPYHLWWHERDVLAETEYEFDDRGHLLCRLILSPVEPSPLASTLTIAVS